MTRAPQAPPENWDASWEGSSARLLEATLRATPAQRLVWLEEAIALAYLSGALPRRKQSRIVDLFGTIDYDPDDDKAQRARSPNG